MTKRKRVDEVRWAWVRSGGRVTIAVRDTTKKHMYTFREDNEVVVRVRVTEVPKKRKGKR